MRTRYTAPIAVVALAAGAAGIAGCSEVAPKVAFAKAYSSTMSQKDAKVTMSVRTTEADVQKLFDAMDSVSDSPADAQTKVGLKAFAKMLPKLTITQQMHSRGADIGSETDAEKIDQSVKVAVDGSGIDVVRVGKEMFVKADVAGIGEKSGLFTGTQVEMITGEASKQAPWVADLVAGKWLAMPTSLMDQVKAGSDSVNDPATMKQLREDMESSMARNASVEKTGEQDGADVFTTKIKLKPFLNDMNAATAKLQKKIEASASASGSPLPTPSASSTMDADGIKDDAVLTLTSHVKNDRVGRTEMDLPQIFDWVKTSDMSAQDKADLDKVKAAGFKGALVMDVSTDGGAITKPSGATQVTEDDLKKLGAGTGSSDDAFGADTGDLSGTDTPAA